jgi:hypothetical protein
MFELFTLTKVMIDLYSVKYVMLNFTIFFAFSRDKTNLDDTVEEKWISLLLSLAGLFPVDEPPKDNNIQINYEGLINFFSY